MYLCDVVNKLNLKKNKNTRWMRTHNQAIGWSLMHTSDMATCMYNRHSTWRLANDIRIK